MAVQMEEPKVARKDEKKVEMSDTTTAAMTEKPKAVGKAELKGYLLVVLLEFEMAFHLVAWWVVSTAA